MYLCMALPFSTPPENPNHSFQSLNRPSKIPKTQNLTDDDEDDDHHRLQQSTAFAEPMTPKPNMQGHLIALEYLGSRFSGSQKQLSCRTVVGVVEDAFNKFIGQPVSVSLSSRTEYMPYQMCHVDVERISKRKPGEVLPPHEAAVVRKAVNHFLQHLLRHVLLRRIKGSLLTNTRYWYFYRLLSGPEPLSTFDKDRSWHVPEELDLLAMKEACKLLVGRHDFSSFRASGCQAKSPIRTLDELSVTEVPSAPYFPSISERQQNSANGDDACCHKFETDLPNTSLSRTNFNAVDGLPDGTGLSFGIRKIHRCYVITARSCSFLYHQVRLLVGVLKCVGTGNLTSADVKRILDAKSVTAASPMAPACGLYLGYVKNEIP